MYSSFILNTMFFIAVFLHFCSYCGAGYAECKHNCDVCPHEFSEPPLSARPRAFWPWLNGYVDRRRISFELEQMKEKGMSGAEMWDISCKFNPENKVPAGPPFLSSQSLKNIKHAVDKAGELGLELGLFISSSWNAGGAWVGPKNASKALFYSVTKVEGPTHFSGKLPFPNPRENTILKSLPRRPDGLPLYYKDVAVLAFPAKADKIIKEKSQIVDLTRRIGDDGKLEWDVPGGKWLIVRFVCTNTGQRLHYPSPNSVGPLLDLFDCAAAEFNMNHVIGRLRRCLGDFEGISLKYLINDSLELYHTPTPTWTGKFTEQFKKHHGYDPEIYLPILMGWNPINGDPLRDTWVVESKDFSRRFLNDWNKTLAELLIDCHHMVCQRIANRNGFLYNAESGGPGSEDFYRPTKALKALGSLNVARGEFWFKMAFPYGNVKEVSSAVHTYGKKIVDAEAFTSGRQWQDGPFDYKLLGDLKLCEGMNRVTFHTFSHSPDEFGKPGICYYAGEHINPNTTWWPKAKPFIYYLARCCYMLQRGLFVADVCYYAGDRAPNFVARKHIDPSLGYGYDYDVANSEVIVNRMDTKNGRIVLPDGMSYALLALPDYNDIDLDVLRKIEKLVKAGATVVGPRPVKTRTLVNYPERDEKIKKISDKLWGQCNGKAIKEHKYGKGKILWGRKLRDILKEQGTGPDFSFTGGDGKTELDYIHRKTGQTDIYFVVNARLRWEEIDCIFRVKQKQPELWFPDTGNVRKHLLYDTVPAGTKVHLRLPPGGSVFVVFRRDTSQNHFTRVTKINKEIFPLENSVTSELPTIEILPTENHNKARLCIFEAGTYILKTASGETKTAKVEQIPAPIEIAGPWKVSFPKGWDAPCSTIFQRLISWTTSDNKGIKFFSGTATYYKEFEIPSELTGLDYRLVLDLGRVEEIADTRLNGKHLGICWKPPFRYDITGIAGAGKNKLTVQITNLWSNRLVGDSHLPSKERYCSTNMFSERTGSSTWPRIPWSQTSLIESGLLGPVRIFTANSSNDITLSNP